MTASVTSCARAPLRLAALACAALALGLAGCSQIAEDYRDSVDEITEIADGVYRIHLVHPWDGNAPRVREIAMNKAIDFCRRKDLGYEPLESATQDGPRGKGTAVAVLFRCVHAAADQSQFRRKED
ncbi:MAG: hypothetical protein HUK26_07090 [Duodenibacillus sp.]|nr:hypothetical protein [Duodenibacillus sp.]